MGRPCDVNYLDARNEVKIAFSDHSKAERVFGKRTKTPLPEGVRAMAEWVRDHGARESNIFEGIEIAKICHRVGPKLAANCCVTRETNRRS